MFIGGKMEEIIIPFAVISALILLLLVTAYVCYHIPFARGKNSKIDPRSPIRIKDCDEFLSLTRPLIDEISATPCDDIYIKARDGVTLYGRYYHVRDGAPLELQFHGYRGHALRDFCGGARDARARGHNLILVDQRAHGKSGGRALSFGIKERYDVLDWIEYSISRFGEDVKIILIGMSMGAATVLMASGLPMPKNVRCVMADCPYSSPRKIISRVVADMKLPPRLLMPLIRLGGIIFGGFDIDSASAEEAVKKSQIPTLIIHGEGDTFVPCEMSRHIFANCKMKKRALLTIPGAEHGISYLVDKERYLDTVVRFMEDALGDDE